VPGVAKGVSCEGILGSYYSNDVSCGGGIEYFSVVGVHLKDSSDVFPLASVDVQSPGTGFEGALIDSEKVQVAVDVAGDLEGEGDEGSFRVALDGYFLLLVVGLMRDDIGSIEWRGQIRQDGVEQSLDAYVLECRADENGIQLVAQGAFPDGRMNHMGGDGLVVDVGIHEVFIVFGGHFEHLAPALLGGDKQVFGDVGFLEGCAQLLALVEDGSHFYEVDYAGERALRPDGQLQDDGIGEQFIADAIDGHLEVGPGLIHLVNEAQARQVVLLSLSPDGLGLCLDTFAAVEHCHGAVEHTERAFDLGGEVDVSRGIDKVYFKFLPRAPGGGGGDGDSSFLLLFEIVHNGGAVVDLAHFVGFSRVIEDPLGDGGLAGVDVGHNAYVS
jgi:hypothetical protein